MGLINCCFSSICFANSFWQESELLTYFYLSRFPTPKCELQNIFETRSRYSHNYVLDKIVFSYGVHLVNKYWHKKTHYVRYFKKIHFGCFKIYQCINKSLYFICVTVLIVCTFVYWKVILVDTICSLFY